jgi:hypothetical protein
MLAVGKKDSSNQFTGMLMGQYEDKNSKKLYGLYGYKDGIQSFGLKEDGTAFFGSSNAGRIEIDGKGGTIKNANNNMVIDFKSGYINIANKIIFNAENPDTTKDSSYYAKIADYFTVDNNGNTKIAGWNIDNNSFYSGDTFASSNIFLCNTGSSTKFDIAGSGKINGWVFKAGSDFGVLNNGAMYASSGKVAGWKIYPSFLGIESANLCDFYSTLSNLLENSSVFTYQFDDDSKFYKIIPTTTFDTFETIKLYNS